MGEYKENYAFFVEWFDPQTRVTRKFTLQYFPSDNSVEMYENKINRMFLKRTRVEGVQMQDFYVGGLVSILGRPMRITDYANMHTKNTLCANLERTFAIIKPDGIPKIGEILDHIIHNGFMILKLKTAKLTHDLAFEFCATLGSTDRSEADKAHMSSGPVVGLVLMARNAICSFVELVGPIDSNEARATAPRSLRALFGSDDVKNAVYGSRNEQEYDMGLNFFFSKDPRIEARLIQTVTYNNSTLCLIKPHAVRDGSTGRIISDILRYGYRITAMRMFSVNTQNASEFYEIYDGVSSEYPAMVAQLVSGLCLALEIVTNDFSPDVQKLFRNFVGPSNPDIARQLKPSTLRAKYGTNIVKNAVHCTDLPEDSLIEVEYFFKILVPLKEMG